MPSSTFLAASFTFLEISIFRVDGTIGVAVDPAGR